MPITSTNQQNQFSFTGGTPGNSAIGDAAAAGTSAAIARADHKHGREASGTPGASAVGDTASTGSATTVALSDHRHSREAFGTPIAVTAGATAASGSATTVARSDHTHSTSGIRVLIASTTLSSSSASITFSSIPQTYTHLELIFGGRTASASTYTNYYAGLQFNGDTASNYVYGTGLQPMVMAFQMHGATNYMAGNAHGQALIPNYTLTMVKHVGSAFASNNRSTTGYDLQNWFTTGVWTGTGAITSIKIAEPFGNSMAIGTYAHLYGIP